MRWVINIATSYLRLIIGILVVFFLTPYIVSTIGKELFGLWSLIFSIVGILGLLDLGFATAAVKYMAEFAGNKDHAGRNETLATLVIIYSLLGLLCLVLVALVATQAGHWLDIAPEQERPFQLALWMIGSAVAINLPLSLFKAVLNGSGRMSLSNGIDIAIIAIHTGGTLWALHQGYGIFGMIVVTAATMVLGPFLAMISAFLLTPGLSVAPRLFSRARVRELLGFSVYFFVSNVAVLIILGIDPIVIKANMPLTAVAVYAIGAKIAEYTYFLNKQFSNGLMPLVSQSRGARDEATINRVLTDGTRFCLAIAVPFAALLFFYAEDLILLWMGEDFAESALVLRILLGAILCTAVQLNAANVLAMNGEHRFVAFAMAGSALINLGLSILLIQHHGLVGVAVATLVAAFSVELLIIVPRACRARGISILNFFVRSVGPSVPPLVPSLATAWGLAQWAAPSNGFLWIILQGACAALVYFASFALIGLRADERATIRAYLHQQGAPARETSET